MEEKVEESKDMTISKARSIRRLFYFGTVLMIISYLLPYVVPYIYPEIPRVTILVISTIISVMVIIFYCIFLIYILSITKKLASPSVSLAEKMMKCKLRIENGLDYCVKCPDSYTCASGKDSKQ